jgi:hypothetical protein
MNRQQLIIPLKDIDGLEIGCENCRSSVVISLGVPEAPLQTCPVCGQSLGVASVVAQEYLAFLLTANGYPGQVGFRITRM